MEENSEDQSELNKNQNDAEISAEEESSEEDEDSVADTSEASDSDGSESSASCPICLRKFSCQQIGFPEDCSSIQHIFCAICIEEWAKNVTTCPIDRKEFTKICIMNNWNDRNVVRIEHVAKKEYNEAEVAAVDDLTYCEVCHRANREHSMLLCDDCDRGYHMECLTPRLTQVPPGSWYCPNCASMHPVEASTATAEEVAESSSGESVDHDTPRILRTRQTERIRAAIFNRGDVFSNDSEDEVQPNVRTDRPGPSRITSTLERVRRALKRGVRKRRVRRKRRTRVRKTVQEYDVNSGDEKFPIKRTVKSGRVTKRKRKTKKRKTKKTKKKGKKSCQLPFSIERNKIGINAMRYNAGVPTVTLFEPSNNLEYFSDEYEPDEPVAVHRIPASGNVLTAIRAGGTIGVNRNLLKRKIIEPMQSSSINILDMIMEDQEKWHTKSGLSNNVILKNGVPVFNRERKNGKSDTPNIQTTQAPLNGNNNNQSVAYGQSNTQAGESQRTSRNTVQSANGTNEGNTTASGSSNSGTNGGNSNNEGVRTIPDSSFIDMNPLPQRPRKTAASRKSFDIFQDDDDSCPNFSVYSSESVNLATNKTDGEQKADDTSEGKQNFTEEGVDLVQLSGEEDDEDSRQDEVTQEVSQAENIESDMVEVSQDIEPQLQNNAPLINAKQDTETQDVKSQNTAVQDATVKEQPRKPDDTQNKSQVLQLYDSDGGLEEELCRAQQDNDNSNYEPQDRSYTPCLDERYPKDAEEAADELERQNIGIDGMDTELISEEEDSNLEIRDDKQPAETEKPKDPVTPFKKLTNTGGRNYRDKERSKRHHSRGRSEDKENSRKPQKKKELQRYNIREVIAKASQRDPFGRTKPRDKSRSKTPPIRRSRSRTRSRSFSRRSFSISRTPSYSPRRRKSRSPTPKRRKSRTPVRRTRRSISRRRSYSRRRSGSSKGSKSSKKSRSSRRSASFSKAVHRSRSHTPPFRRKVGKRKEKGKKKKHRSKDRKRRVPVSRSSRSRTPPIEHGAGWSRRNSPQRQTSITRHPSPSWTPPLGTLKGSQENLRVVLQNRVGQTTATRKKKEKKKKAEKKKVKESRREKRHRNYEKSIGIESNPKRPPPTSKEVFASGDNILVSVSFNNTADKTTSLTEPDREVRRVERDPTKTLQLRDPTAKPPRKHRKTDAKPVAYIDLDGSPFNEVPPSPVIILSDSDHERESADRRVQETVAPDHVVEQVDECVRPASPPESPNVEDQFRTMPPGGPKTPPGEPALGSIKFSMPSKQRLRVINTIFEDDEEDANNRPAEEAKQASAANKIGPNTPPEPTPKSPDVYDPFEPTKSPSESSNTGDHADDHDMHDDGPPSRSSTPPLEETEQVQQQLKEQEKPTINPVDLVMSLINKSASDITTRNTEKDAPPILTIESCDEITEIHPNENDIPAEKQITILSNVVVQTPSKYSLHTTARTQPQNSTPTRPINRSPAAGYKTVGGAKISIKPLSALNANTSGSIISKLPLPRTTSNNKSHAAVNNDMDIDSPYSPGSSDFDDLFEPPSSTTDNYKPSHTKTANVTSTTRAPGGAKDVFDNLFGSATPPHKFSTVTTTYKINAKAKPTRNKARMRTRRSRFDDDEVPSSAVELQVKDKLLRKLNRQERVIEEVKLVIKPHYNKKRINKEEYKEIMRKAVPKICHSRSGEINPVKIQALVEAYVKKVRHRRKAQMKLQAAV